MGKDTLGIGVIGCGGMGRSVVRKVLQQDERLQVTALFDPDERSVKTTLDMLDNEPVVCDSYQDVVARDDVDWVMIASWNKDHAEQTEASFAAGKHVFCQKPLALSVEECVRMKKAGEKSGKQFNIGFTLRYSPHYRKIKELLSEGRIGKIISMEFNETLAFNHGGYIMGDWRRLRENAGTHLLEKCCHDVDLVNWMTDSRPIRVASFGGNDFFTPENAHYADDIGPNKDGKKAFQSWGGLVDKNPFLSDKDIVDNQVAIIQYENGIRSTFHTNCNSGIPERRMYICGTEGTIRADVITGTIQLQRIGWDTKIEDVSSGSSGGHGGGDQILAKELADSMLNGTPPSVGLIEGMKSAIACFAIDEALDTGTIVDLTDWWKKAGI
jgi:predicted dehydrogenase